MQTLEELAAQRASDDAQRLADAKQLAAPVLASLREAKGVVKKRLPAWLARAGWAQKRRTLLAIAGVKDMNLDRVLGELVGSPHNALTGGLLYAIEPQIDAHIAQIENMTLRDLVDGVTLGARSMDAGNDRGCIGFIEDNLTALEAGFADGGELYEAYRRKLEAEPSAQAAPITVPLSPRHDAPLKVETAFSLDSKEG